MHNLFAHVVWTTLGRLPLIDPRRANAVEAHLISISRRLDVRPVSLAALHDHVQLLIQFNPGQSLAELVGSLKRGSSDQLVQAGHPVHWSGRFSVSTVSPEDVRRVMRRIGRQQMDSAASRVSPSVDV
jgi:REP element-mobilizing transposase RayT